MTDGDIFHIPICEALNASCRMDSILSTYKGCIKLPTDMGIEFTMQTFQYLQQTMILHNHGGDKLFNVTYKHHCMAHCCIRGQTINPRLSWCYMGEDHMKQVRKICSPCTRGVPLLDMHKKGLVKMVRATDYSYENL